MKIWHAAVLAISLSGCAVSTGVVPMGQNTFMTTVEDRSPGASMGDAKVAVLKQAGEFCKDKGGDFQVISSTDVPRAFGQFPNSSIQFRCVGAK